MTFVCQISPPELLIKDVDKGLVVRVLLTSSALL